MFKILDEVCTPKRGTKYSAYVDLFAREDVVIGAGETKIVKLGVKIDLQSLLFKNRYSNLHLKNTYTSYEEDIFLSSHYLEVSLRSSLGVKGLIIANGIGIIDLDYPDEIGLIVHNPIYQTRLTNISDETSSKTIVHFGATTNRCFKISKGDKVAQCTLKEHKGYLMGYESDVIRDGGFGSTGK